MRSLSSVRARLVATVLLAVAPAWIIMHYAHLPWCGFALGMAALIVAWVGGEAFVMRQMRQLLRTTEQLAAGDSSARTGLSREGGEFGDLARRIDSMAEKMQEREREREATEKTLL